MSQWTHVSGCIRIDGIPQIGLPPDLKALLGTPSSRDYDAEPYEGGKDIPGGSEGTIQYEIIHAGEGMVWKTVAVWGDLRDFGAGQCVDIDAWFRRVVEQSGLMIRAAHLLVRVEYGDSYVLVANGTSVGRIAVTRDVAERA